VPVNGVAMTDSRSSSEPPPADEIAAAARPIDRLLAIMRRLRDPERGCPWDIEQDFSTIAPYTIEEAYEVADAIARGDVEDLRTELGDLLLQVVFHAQMAAERGLFDFEAVAAAAAEKMIRRHPHIFGDARIDTAEAQRRSWEELKAAERERKAARTGGRPSALDGLPHSLPALMRALKLQERAARVGFDWPEPAGILDKIEEEVGELRAELASDGDPEARRMEVGDLLFTLVNLARRLEVDPETALRLANGKFERRFRAMEKAAAARGQRLEALAPEELDALWQAAKTADPGDQ